jgi:hypothetical protein
MLENYLNEVIDNENDEDEEEEEEETDIYKRTLFLIYFILFEISTQFGWLLGNNI